MGRRRGSVAVLVGALRTAVSHEHIDSQEIEIAMGLK